MNYPYENMQGLQCYMCGAYWMQSIYQPLICQRCLSDIVEIIVPNQSNSRPQVVRPSVQANFPRNNRPASQSIPNQQQMPLNPAPMYPDNIRPQMPPYQPMQGMPYYDPSRFPGPQNMRNPNTVYNNPADQRSTLVFVENSNGNQLYRIVRPNSTVTQSTAGNLPPASSNIQPQNISRPSYIQPPNNIQQGGSNNTQGMGNNSRPSTSRNNAQPVIAAPPMPRNPPIIQNPGSTSAVPLNPAQNNREGSSSSRASNANLRRRSRSPLGPPEKRRCTRPMTHYEMRRIERISKKQLKEGDIECGICYDGYEDKRIIRRLQCQHIYHQVCIFGWLKKSATCPFCRCELLEDN